MYGVLSTRSRVLSETKVIVRAQVDASRLGSSELERPSTVLGDTILKHYGVGGDAANRPIPAVLYASVNVIEVKSLEVIKQRHIAPATILSCDFGHEEQLIDVADEHQEIKAEVCKAGGDERGFFKALFGFVLLFVLECYLQKAQKAESSVSRHFRSNNYM